jgi:hypothetical protein
VPGLGRPTLDPTDLVDRRAMRFLSQGGAWNHVAMKQAIADSGLEESDIGQRAHRHHHGLRRSVHPHADRAAEITHQEQQPEAHRPVCRAEGDVLDRFGDARDLVQDPRRQLFDLVGLRDLGHCIGNAYTR